MGWCRLLHRGHLHFDRTRTRFCCGIGGRRLVPWRGMPITPTNPFKGRHFPGEVIVQCVRWYLPYPWAYEHVSPLMAERGVPVDPSCIWRGVQAYAPEIHKRCRPHRKSTNKSYRTDETYMKVKGQDHYLYRAVDSTGQTIDFLWTSTPLSHRQGKP